MISIILCEDNFRERNQITSIINNAIEANDYYTNIVLNTDNPMEVIGYLDNTPGSINIYFLDIALPVMNGLVLAKEIRKRDINGYIIFITTHSELSLMTFEYKVQALDFIIKDDFPKMKARIRECIEVAYREYTDKKVAEFVYLPVQTAGRITNIRLDEVEYFETSDKIHKICVHTRNEQIEFYSSMKELKQKVSSLSEDFCQINQSFLVNIRMVKFIDKNSLIATMRSGVQCKISRRFIKELRHRCSQIS